MTTRATLRRRTICVVVAVGGIVLILFAALTVWTGLRTVDPEDGPTWFDWALLLAGVGAVGLGVRLAPRNHFHAPPRGR